MNPCPFCGCTLALPEVVNRFPHLGEDPGPDGWVCFYRCNGCAAVGPWAKGHDVEQAKRSALQWWDRRVACPECPEDTA